MRDVIIIGAGGGGPVVAKELAARGLDVLLLEAGPRFANTERTWSRLENEMANPVTGHFRFGPADRSKPAWRRELAQNSNIWQDSGVGGSTQHYFANSPRALPGVFASYHGVDRSAYDVAHLFPFAYRDLIPYYEWVEHTLPVQTAPLGTKEDVFFRGAAAMGLPHQTTKDTIRAGYRAQENAILQPRGNAGKTNDPKNLIFPAAAGCTFCGHCSHGCVQPIRAPRNLKAKRSTDNSYIPMALTADLWTRGKAVTLLTDAVATRIHIDEHSIARAVTWRTGSTGETFTEEATVVILAAGAIESPRLWLNSGLPNPNGWVGRGLTDHFLDVIVGVMPFYTGGSKGPGSAARVEYPGFGALENSCYSPALLAFASSLSDGGFAGIYNNGSAAEAFGANSLGRLPGPALKTLLSNLDRTLGVIALTDDDVELHNSVKLSSSAPPDEHGSIPRIDINGRNRSARTLRNREFLAARAVEILRHAGAQWVARFNWPPVLLHSHSTMRMGSSSENSVLNDDGEARWVKGLFIADNSALPNALGGANPTLTTQALATRTAEKIFQKYFDGDSWIENESPCSSVDRIITKAVLDRGIN